MTKMFEDELLSLRGCWRLFPGKKKIFREYRFQWLNELVTKKWAGFSRYETAPKKKKDKEQIIEVNVILLKFVLPLAGTRTRFNLVWIF